MKDETPSWKIAITIVFSSLTVLLICFVVIKTVICGSDISSLVVVLIAFLLVLSIGLNYDNISITKILQLKKNAEEKEKQSTEYKNRYDKLAESYALVLKMSQNQTIYNNNSNDMSVRNESIKSEDLDNETVGNKYDSEIIKKYKENNFISENIEFEKGRRLSFKTGSGMNKHYYFDSYFIDNNKLENFILIKKSDEITKDYIKELSTKIEAVNIYSASGNTHSSAKLHLIISDSVDEKNYNILKKVNELTNYFATQIGDGIFEINTLYDNTENQQ